MTRTTSFHLSDVLSISTGRLVSTRLVEGIYDILGWMTGEQLYTHQLPRAWKECEPVLRAAHPSLPTEDDIDVDLTHEPTCRIWLQAMIEKHGEYLDVPQLPERDPQYDTPIADAIEMVGDPTKVIVSDPEIES